MRRSLYIPLLALAALLVFALGTGRYVRRRTGDWISRLETADGAARQEDWDLALELMEDVRGDWDRSQTFLHIVMEHEDLDEAEIILAESLTVCGERDGPAFRVCMVRLKEQLKLLGETQCAGIRNIL